MRERDKNLEEQKTQQYHLAQQGGEQCRAEGGRLTFCCTPIASCYAVRNG